MDRTSKVKMVIAATALGMFGAAAAIAQDKYALRTPSGIAFSDFKGYEDWAVVSSARTDEVLKVIVGNPVIVKAYKAGVPGNGQPFPEGSKAGKASMEAEEEHRGSVRCRCAGRVFAGVRHGEEQREVPDDGRLGICALQLRNCLRQVHGGPQPRRLRSCLPRRGEGEGLHLSSIPKALNAAGEERVNPDVERGSVGSGLALEEGVKANRDGRGKVTLRGAFDSALPDVEGCSRQLRARTGDPVRAGIRQTR